jgi:hypothetical protein
VRWLLVIFATACAAEPRALPPSPAAQLDLDVVVLRDSVQLFANGSDVRPCMAWRFPQAGQSAGWSDENDCSQSCLSTAEVFAAGNSIALMRTGIDLVAAMTEVTNESDAELVLEGCGGSARIPIGGISPLTAHATATADVTGRVITVGWWADTDASSAMIIYSASLWSAVHHVAVHDDVFTLPTTNSPDVWIDVWAFAPVIPIATDYGVVRVWHGDEKSQLLGLN